jgi:hypothetical protein
MPTLGAGTNLKKQSWYPLVSTFEGNGDDQGRWSPRLEDLYQKRQMSILAEGVTINRNLLFTASQWRDKTRASGDARRSTSSVEIWLTQFLDTYCRA